MSVLIIFLILWILLGLLGMVVIIRAIKNAPADTSQADSFFSDDGNEGRRE